MGFRQLPDWWAHGGAGRRAGRRRRGLHFPPHLAVCLSPAGCSEVNLCNKLVIWQVKCFPETQGTCDL